MGDGPKRKPWTEKGDLIPGFLSLIAIVLFVYGCRLPWRLETLAFCLIGAAMLLSAAGAVWSMVLLCNRLSVVRAVSFVFALAVAFVCWFPMV